MANKCHRTVN